MENGTSLSKSHLGKIHLGMSTRGWKECRRRRTFPVNLRRLSTNRVPQKEVFFREIRSLNGNLSGI